MSSTLLALFSKLPDPRRRQGKMYPLAPVLLFTVLAMLAGARSYRQVHAFIETHLDRLNAALGTNLPRAPAYSSVRFILHGLDGEAVEPQFRAHAAGLLTPTPENAADGLPAISVDGKTLRGSFDAFNDRKAVHLLSAFAADEGVKGVVVTSHPPSVTNALTNTWSTYRDGIGRAVQTTDPLGNATQLTWDDLFGVKSVADPMGHTASVVYDAVGNITQRTDPNQNVTKYTWDCRNRFKTHTDPLTNADSTSSGRTVPSTCATGGLGNYDGNSDLLGWVDRNHQSSGTQIAYTWDDFGEPLSATYPDGSTTNYTWNLNGKLTQIVDSVGGTITRTYDTLNRLTQEKTAQGTITYSYDNADRLTIRKFTGAVDGIAYTYTYQWYSNNWLQSITNGSSVVSFTYNGDGTRASMTLPNGVLACYAYDAAREVQSISYLQSGTCANPGTSVGNLTYAYDAAGRVVSRGGSLFTSVLPQQVTSAVYNADNQLTKRTTPGSAFNLGYDANGNLLCTGVNIQTCSGTSYTWDSRNRLTAVSDGSSYLYDGLGRREQTVLNGATRQYLYDGSNVVEDQLSGQTAGNPILTGPSLDERYGRANNGTWTYMLTDALGSTVALSNPTTGAVQTNYAYDPYGVTTTTGSAIVNTNRYTGREFDSTVLYYYRGRYYTPATGRFISEDPIGFGGGDSNLYRYVGGRPTMWRDPTGLIAAGVGVGGSINVGSGGLFTFPDWVPFVGGQDGIMATASGQLGLFSGDGIGGNLTAGTGYWGPNGSGNIPSCNKKPWNWGGDVNLGRNIWFSNASSIAELNGLSSVREIDLLLISVTISDGGAGIWEVGIGIGPGLGYASYTTVSK